MLTQAPLACLCSSKFYEKEAVLMDPVDGPILASLLGNYFSLSIKLMSINIYCVSLYGDGKYAIFCNMLD